MTDLRIGTSAFTASGWESAFYPAGMKPAEYLSYYVTKFNTVEVASTFYSTPRSIRTFFIVRLNVCGLAQTREFGA